MRKQDSPRANDDLGFNLPAPGTVSRTRIAGLVGAVAALLAVAFLAGYVPRRRERDALVAGSALSGAALTRCEVVTPKVLTSDRAVVLPGTAQPLEEAVLYARANGFVRRWLVDIGDKVKLGQLLAELDTPELDQELEQAKAQLAQTRATLIQARATRDLSVTNLGRYKQLAPAGVASQQELDQRQAQAQVDEASVTVAEAGVNAQHANIRRLEQLKSFASVTAPFDGTITERTIGRGALVAPGNATPLYKIAAIDPARILIQVPQDVAPSVHPDIVAKVSVREYPSRAFDGRVARAASALDSMSRTMTTEVRVPNPDGLLLPGMYVEVSLSLQSPHRAVEIPATALMNDAQGMRVAVVTGESKIHFVHVVVEHDRGPTLEISNGLTGEERVVRIGGPQLSEGLSVDVIP